MLTTTFWRELCGSAGADLEKIEVPLRTILQYYSEPSRHYHTLSHVNDCLARLDEAKEQAQNLIALQFAIIYHDLIYQPGSSENEQQSAELAKQSLLGMGIKEDLVNTVCGLILNTKHDHVPETADGQLIADIDLAGLGLPYQEFEATGKSVREEFADVPDDAYFPRRKQFFESLLAKERIFYTDFFFQKCEQTTCENLTLWIQNFDKETGIRIDKVQ